MKKYLITFFILIFSFETIFASSKNKKSNLEIANEKYDSNDYKMSEIYYKNAILDGEQNGVIFYRLGFSLENNLNSEEKTLREFTEDKMKKSYKSAVYFFKRDKNLDNPYYEKTLKKLSQYSLEDNFTENDVKDFIDSMRPAPVAPITFISELFGGIIDSHPVIFVVVAIIIYLIAVFLSNDTGCVIAFHYWDLLIMLVPNIILILCATGSLDEDGFIANFIFFLGLGGTLAMSIIGNKENGLLAIPYVTVSMLTKTLLLIIIPIYFIFVLWAKTSSGISDRRYRDGTKGNARTAWIAFSASIGSIFILPLIKSSPYD